MSAYSEKFKDPDWSFDNKSLYTNPVEAEKLIIKLKHISSMIKELEKNGIDVTSVLVEFNAILKLKKSLLKNG